MDSKQQELRRCWDSISDCWERGVLIPKFRISDMENAVREICGQNSPRPYFQSDALGGDDDED